jgi:hypothetical protein
MARGKPGAQHLKHALTIGLAATFALIASAASADEGHQYLQTNPRVTRDHPQIGVRIGYGIYAGDELPGDVNPYGLGVGLTAGYSFGSLYLGVSGEYYLGGITEKIDDEPTANIWSAMFEPGWDILLNKKGYILRPQVGVGLSSFHQEACITIPGADPAVDDTITTCENDTVYKLAVAPGAMFMIDDLGGFYGQIGARYHHIFLDEGNAGGVLLNVGVGAAW